MNYFNDIEKKNFDLKSPTGNFDNKKQNWKNLFISIQNEIENQIYWLNKSKDCLLENVN